VNLPFVYYDTLIWLWPQPHVPLDYYTIPCVIRFDALVNVVGIEGHDTDITVQYFRYYCAFEVT
jgi:hypothetical protein